MSVIFYHKYYSTPSTYQIHPTVAHYKRSIADDEWLFPAVDVCISTRGKPAYEYLPYVGQIGM